MAGRPEMVPGALAGVPRTTVSEALERDLLDLLSKGFLRKPFKGVSLRDALSQILHSPA